MSNKEFILLRILNRKVVAIIAILIALVSVCPCKGAFNLTEIRWAVVWFIGGICVWKGKTWAAVLLALFASYELIVYLIPDIQSLKSDITNWKKDFENMPELLIYRLAITVYLVGVIVESYVICYGLKKIIMDFKSKYSIRR